MNTGTKKTTLAGMVLSLILISLAFPGCTPQYDPRDTPAPEPPPEAGGTPFDSLGGTVWVWDSAWGRRTLEFHPSAMTVAYLGQDGDDYTESYTYNSTTKTGTIAYYAEAGFTISADNQTMRIAEWKNYGHGCEFARLGMEILSGIVRGQPPPTAQPCRVIGFPKT
jgi:hypothetical protein